MPYYRKSLRNPAKELRIAARLLRQAARFPDAAWLQHCTSLDENGQYIPPESPLAVRHCALGRLLKVGAAEVNSHAVSRLLPAVATLLPDPFESLSRWNDSPTTTPQAVRKAFRQAAQALDTQAQEMKAATAALAANTAAATPAAEPQTA